MDNEINILMSVNKMFLEHIEELIYSLVNYTSKKIRIYLMYVETELSNNDLEYIKEFANNTEKATIEPIKFDVKELEGMPITDNEGAFFGLEAYSRLFCAFKLPQDMKKILYLDADMICTGDITELYDLDFEDKIWIAVPDNGIKEKDLHRLGLPSGYKYINSGMLLINVPKLKANYSEKYILEKIKENKDILIYPDQDFINKVFKDEIKVISNKYNLIAKDIRYKQLEEKPLIIHYAGSVKPWHENVSRFEKEYIVPYYEAMKAQGENKKEKLEKLMQKHKENGYNEN